MTIFGASRGSSPAPVPVPACVAPDINLHFLPDGEVRACSRSTLMLGRWPHQTVREIWDGWWRGEVRRRLAVGDFSAGCQGCGREFDLESRAGSIAAAFDQAPGGATARTEVPVWPLRFDFMLSNICNLQCVQCNGEFSSSIRRHRERRPPLTSPYDEAFVDQLEEFLPHLEGAQFAGGEPFLVPINFAIWERIARVAPELNCTIITNGVRLTDKAEAALDSIRAHFVVSMDSLDPIRGAALRVGSDIDEVVRNVERFRSYAARRGTTVGINACIMRENVDDLVPLGLFAEERGILLNIVPVREPASVSLAAASLGELDDAARRLRRAVDAAISSMPVNGEILDVTAARVERWAELRRRGTGDDVVVMLRPRRPNSLAVQRAIREVAAEFPGANVRTERLDPDVVSGCDSSLGPLPASTLLAVLTAVGADVEACGALVDHEVLQFDDEKFAARIRFERGVGRIALVGSRSRRGKLGLSVIWAL